jgi:hypothetical protein
MGNRYLLTVKLGTADGRKGLLSVSEVVVHGAPVGSDFDVLLQDVAVLFHLAFQQRNEAQAITEPSSGSGDPDGVLYGSGEVPPSLLGTVVVVVAPESEVRDQRRIESVVYARGCTASWFVTAASMSRLATINRAKEELSLQ